MYDINIDPITGSKEIKISSSVRIYNDLSHIVEVGIRLWDKNKSVDKDIFKPESFIKDIKPKEFLHIPFCYLDPEDKAEIRF